MKSRKEIANLQIELDKLNERSKAYFDIDLSEQNNVVGNTNALNKLLAGKRKNSHQLEKDNWDLFNEINARFLRIKSKKQALEAQEEIEKKADVKGKFLFGAFLVDRAAVLGFITSALNGFFNIFSKTIGGLVEMVAGGVGLGTMAFLNLWEFGVTLGQLVTGQQVGQSKTRIATGIATLGVLGIGLGVVFKAIAATFAIPLIPLALPVLPLLFIGIVGLAIYKEHYILNQKREKIKQLEDQNPENINSIEHVKQQLEQQIKSAFNTNEIKEKQNEITQAKADLQTLLSSENKEEDRGTKSKAQLDKLIKLEHQLAKQLYDIPAIKQASAELDKRSQELQKLKIEEKYGEQKRNRLGLALLGGVLLTVSALFPPLAALSLAGLGVFFVAGVLHKRAHDKEAAELAKLDAINAERIPELEQISSISDKHLSLTKGLERQSYTHQVQKLMQIEQGNQKELEKAKEDKVSELRREMRQNQVAYAHSKVDSYRVEAENLKKEILRLTKPEQPSEVQEKKYEVVVPLDVNRAKHSHQNAANSGEIYGADSPALFHQRRPSLPLPSGFDAANQSTIRFTPSDNDNK